jgi:hypothetical protein
VENTRFVDAWNALVAHAQPLCHCPGGSDGEEKCCEYKEMCPESDNGSGGKYRQLEECESVCVKLC